VAPDSPDPALDFLRPAAPKDEARLGLGVLWDAVYGRLSPADRSALGTVRIGALDLSEEAVPFAYTNADDDRVNLTLELAPDQLELNLVGWTVTQSDALKNWLQSVRGENTVNSLTNFTVIAFVRRAYKKTPASRPWWQSETVTVLGACDAAAFNAGWVTGVMIKLSGSSKDVKPAFHIRRVWDRATASRQGNGVIDQIAVEVRGLLPILREIWTVH
jgi:hypothetical protein